jgi:hypothetical protein
VRLVAVLGLALLAGCGASEPAVPVVAATTPAPVPPASAVPSAPPNRAPELDLRIAPPRIRGTAPLRVEVDLCRTGDPDGDALRFAFEWSEEGKRLVDDCRRAWIYEHPLRATAYFCASDGQPDHLVCRRFEVDVR